MSKCRQRRLTNVLVDDKLVAMVKILDGILELKEED